MDDPIGMVGQHGTRAALGRDRAQPAQIAAANPPG
jgi:hypothetical protein